MQGEKLNFDEKEKPGISNLLTIHSALSGKKISELENEFAGQGYGDFKGAVAEVVVEYLRPIRARALELLEDEATSFRFFTQVQIKRVAWQVQRSRKAIRI
jgi:tryptophanyl-tRNA synthetase